MRLLASAVLSVVFCLGAAQADTLTGAVIFSVNSSGTPVLGQVWNTQGSDGTWNLYVQNGSGWVNNGNAAGTSIDIPLSTGGNSWSLYAAYSEIPVTYMGIDLFFNGATTPGISVFTKLSGGPVQAIPSSTPVYSCPARMARHRQTRTPMLVPTASPSS